MKVVHEEDYKGLRIVVKASFDNSHGVRLNSKSEWYMGIVDLYAEIIKDGRAVKACNTATDIDQFNLSQYDISFKRKYIRTGFLNLKKKYYIVHISDEYNRVLPLYIERVKELADRYVSVEYDKMQNQLITDGLPGSLKEL